MTAEDPERTVEKVVQRHHLCRLLPPLLTTDLPPLFTAYLRFCARIIDRPLPPLRLDPTPPLDPENEFVRPDLGLEEMQSGEKVIFQRCGGGGGEAEMRR